MQLAIATTGDKKMDLAVRDVISHVGMDGFNASIYLGTKRIAVVTDDGKGDPMKFEWIGEDSFAKRQNELVFYECITSLPSEYTLHSADIHVARLADAYLAKQIGDASKKEEQTFGKLWGSYVVFRIKNEIEDQLYASTHSGKISRTKNLVTEFLGKRGRSAEFVFEPDPALQLNAKKQTTRTPGS